MLRSYYKTFMTHFTAPLANTFHPIYCYCMEFVCRQAVRKEKKIKIVRFEVFIAVTMKNAVFWDVAPCRSCVNRRFEGTYHLHLQGPQSTATYSLRFLSRRFFYLKMEVTRSSETSVHTRSTRRHVPEDGIL
jgi:hypothetical protein